MINPTIFIASVPVFAYTTSLAKLCSLLQTYNLSLKDQLKYQFLKFV